MTYNHHSEPFGIWIHRAVLLIWSQPEQPLTAPAPRIPWRAGLALGALLVLNLALGCLAPPVWTVIQSGLAVIG